MVKNDTIEFKDKIPLQQLPNNPKVTAQEELLIAKALEEMIKKDIIKENAHEEVEFSQNIMKV